jgi:prepilin-type N-terminal cleavage/methylation domain-containing protein
MRKQEAGFTLIEIIITLVLVGILSVFVALFLTSFLNSSFLIKNNSDTAMKAQMAMDRISVELKEVSAVSVLTTDSLITYKNRQIDPSGADRTIKFQGSNLYLSTPSDNILIDQVQAFQLSGTYRNVYNIAANDVAFIDIGFTIAGYPPFSTRIFPRNRIPHP